MSFEDLIKNLRRELDTARLQAKYYRKRHDREHEEYWNGRIASLVTVIEWIKEVI